MHYLLLFLPVFLVFSMAPALSASPVPALSPVPPALPMDFTAPDGLVYPNFTYAGVPGGIPNIPVAARIADFGGKPGQDISSAIERGAQDLAAKGGGALLIGPGTYFLDRPVLIAGSGIVLRGSGRDQTRLVFRWEPARDSVDFIGLKDGDAIPPGRILTIAAWNDSRDNKVVPSLQRLALEINGKVVAEQTGTEGPWFTVSPDNRTSAEFLAAPGEHELRAVAEYIDGRKAEKRIRVSVATNPELLGASARDAAITFAEPTAQNNNGWGNSPQPIMARGDTSLEVGNLSWAPGDIVQINDSNGGYWFGHPLLVVASASATRLVFTQPVRKPVTVANVRRRVMMRHSGLEDLTLEQTSGHWTHLVRFERDYGCWIRGVRLLNAGRNPIEGMTKNFELRDTIVDGARFHFGVGGGTGYLGFSNAQDCLMVNVQARRLRHAPNFQYGSMGCVIRDCRFEDSDAQLHAAPNWENLLETTVVDSRGSKLGYGSYGTALSVVARPPTTPLGSGIVFYGNDFSSMQGPWGTGGPAIAFDGGSGTGWILAYNRFIHDRGPALRLSPFASELRLQGNVFAAMRPAVPAIVGDVSGLVLAGNTFTSWTAADLFELGAKPALDQKNAFADPGFQPAPSTQEGGAAYLAHFNTTYVPAARASSPPPTRPMPSLHDWQIRQSKRLPAPTPPAEADHAP